jgi:DNA-binding transcriptional LysR family regulator
MTYATIRQLRALLAIKQRGTIIAAAKELHLTGPAVTLQLKQLEEDAGVALFDRTAHGMRPTIAGTAFIEAAEAVIERLRRLDLELDEIRGAKKGSVNVGVVSNAHYFAPQLATAFMAEYPAIDVQLFMGKRQEAISRLKNFDVDILLTARPPRDVSVRAMAFAEYRLGIVSAPDNPLAARDALAVADLLSEPFIVREPGSGPRVSFERFLANAKVKGEVHWIEMATNETIKQAVMSDLGIAFVALHSVSAEIADGRLVVLDVQGLPICSQWFAVTRSDRSITPAMAAFQAFLQTNAEHHLHAHDLPFGHDDTRRV